MPNVVNVSGLAAIKLNTASGSLELLGYSRDGVQIVYESFLHDVPGDENGGESGPPIEQQILGIIARIRMSLTKYDEAVLKKVEALARSNSANWGSPPPPGTLLINTTNSYRVLIHTPVSPRNFPMAIPSAPIEVNKGTKYSEAILEWTAYKNQSGILVDETTT